MADYASVYSDPTLGNINTGISMTWGTRNPATSATDNPLVHHHLTAASNAILSAAGSHSKGDINRALISVDSALLHWRDAAQHLRLINEEKIVVMNPGLRYLMENDAPKEMIERHQNWENDNSVLGAVADGEGSTQ
jgi:hypothetical protein